MNDTTRGELRGEVWSIIRGAMNTPQADNFEAESAYRDAWASEAADKVVALVTAARDAEIREALNTVSWADIATAVLMADEYGGNYDDLLRQVTDEIWGAQEAALDHIGLGDETGGQG